MYGFIFVSLSSCTRRILKQKHGSKLSSRKKLCSKNEERDQKMEQGCWTWKKKFLVQKPMNQIKSVGKTDWYKADKLFSKYLNVADNKLLNQDFKLTFLCKVKEVTEVVTVST